MLDKWIQTLQAGDCLAERDLKKLCLMVRKAQTTKLPAFFSCGVIFNFLHARQSSRSIDLPA